jgi:hypothetical protein
LYDLEVDVDALVDQGSKRDELLEPTTGPNVLVDRHNHNH